jgi:hypothetical protein
MDLNDAEVERDVLEELLWDDSLDHDRLTLSVFG